MIDRREKKIRGKIAALFCVCFLTTGIVSAVWSSDRPNLLVLHSYGPTYQWTRNINNGISDTLENAGTGVDVTIEYMDITKNRTAPQFELLRSLYRHKYPTAGFDAILCSDNHALDFLIRHRAALFPGIPIVFCGINRFEDRVLKGQKGITGVVEEIDLKASIKVMLRLHGALDRIVIWGLGHKRGEKNREQAVSIIRRGAPAVRVVHLQDKSLNQGIKEIRNLAGKTAVLLLSVIQDNRGRVIPVDITARTISAAIDHPVYSLWDFFLGHGIVGGKLTSGFEQGRISARMALRIIGGTPATDIPIVRKSPNRFMFDHRQLQRFKIAPENLPEGAIIINQPVSVYTDHWRLIWGIASVILLLAVLIVVLGATIVRKMRVENELQQNRDLLEKRVQTRTHELSEANLELKRFEQMVSTTPALILLFDRNYVVRYVNEAFLEAFQKDRDDIVDRSMTELMGRKLFEKVSKNHIDLAFDGHTVEFETWIELPVMGRSYLIVHYHPISDSEGSTEYVSLAARDITALKESENSLKILTDRLSLATRAARTGVWEWDRTAGRLIWDEQMMQIYGLTPRQFTGKFEDWRNRVHPEDIEAAENAFVSAMEQPEPFELEFRIIRPDGDVRHIRAAALTRFDVEGNSARVIGVHWDISKHKRMEADLTRLATIDSLTGISNRNRFLEKARNEFIRCLRYNSPFAMLMIDIDNFKSINDTYGHLVGDAVLKEMAQQSLAVLRENDLFGRIGGEEFCAILIETELDNAAEVAERLRQAIEQMWVETENGAVRITVSVGLTNLREGDNDLKMVIRRADKALYQAKEAGRNRAVEI